MLKLTNLNPNPAKAGQSVVGSKAAILGGYAFCESTGSARAKFVLRDGKNASAPSIMPITLNPGESVRDVFAYQGPEDERAIPLQNGAVFLDLIEGEIEGMVLWK